MAKARKKQRKKIAGARRRSAGKRVGARGRSRSSDALQAIAPGDRARLAASVSDRGSVHSFLLHYPDLGVTETRIAHVGEGHVSLPAGKYAFTENYCIEPECDCRRTRIYVVALDGYEILATFGYGWASEAHYRRWMDGFPSIVSMQGAYLEPLAEQGPHALALLELFEHLLEDELYQARIRKHYRLMKEAIP